MKFKEKMEELLPEWEAFDVIAHELLMDMDCWNVNDSWRIARNVDREDAISALHDRWHIFKENYAKQARIKDIEDANYSGEEYPSLLEVDCIPFAEIRNGGE